MAGKMKITVDIDNISSIANKIRQDVADELKKKTKEYADHALEGMENLARSTIQDFYFEYPAYPFKDENGKQHRYVRTNNLPNMIVPGKVKSISRGPLIGHSAFLITTSGTMKDNYNISPDVVYNFVWNEGIRGLPGQGLSFFTEYGTAHETMSHFVNNFGDYISI